MLRFALAAQLILTIFVPPYDLHPRKIFAGDLWFLLWVPYFLGVALITAKASTRRSLLTRTTIIGLPFLFAFLHGPWKYPFQQEVWALGFINYEGDVFQPFRELVVALRLAIWGVGALVVTHHFSSLPRAQKVKDLEFLECICRWSFIGIGGTALLAKLFPVFEKALGKVYGYDPNSYNWRGRIYGVFSSPVEAGTVLAFGLLLLFTFPKKKSYNRVAAAVFSVIGAALSHTLTPVVAAFLAQGVRLQRYKKALFWVSGVLGLPVGIFYITQWSQSGFLNLKIADFLIRTKFWWVYLRASFSRWDFFLFGNGFTKYYTDNAYIYFLNRGGFLLLGALVAVSFHAIWKYWRTWSYSQQALVIFILISNISLDTIIMRPIIALWICVALPVLCLSQCDREKIV